MEKIILLVQTDQKSFYGCVKSELVLCANITVIQTDLPRKVQIWTKVRKS